MSLTVKNYEQLLQQMINVMAARSPLNDVTDASIMKHMLAAPAREMDEIGFQLVSVLDLFSPDTATGEDLDERAAEVQPDAITRLGAKKATGTVTFSRSGTTGTQAIPAGTVVKTVDGISVSTTATGSIPNGDDTSAAVAAVAVVAGVSGNVAAGTLVRFDSKPAGVDTVTNVSAFVGGQDVETDDALRARMKRYMRSLGRGTPTALLFAALGATIDSGKVVAFAHVYEDEENRGEVILYIDDGSGTAEEIDLIVDENITAGLGGPANGGDSAVGGEVFLYLDRKPVRPATESAPITLKSSLPVPNTTLVHGTDYLLEDASGQIKLLSSAAQYANGATAGEVLTAGYTAYAGLIEEVQKIVDGDPADRETYPGWRAAGVRVRVRPPVVLQQVVVASVYVSDGYERAEVEENVEAAIQTYINNLGISGDVVRAELVAAIMGVNGVYNTTVSSPANDVILLDDQLPRVTSDNITLT